MSEKLTSNQASSAEVLRITMETLRDLKNMAIAEIMKAGYANEVTSANFLEGKTFEQLDAITQAIENGENPIKHFSEYLK
jgi:hypothetical protein